MPSEWTVCDMIRADLAAARVAWLAEANDVEAELKRRTESDFLLETNHDGGRLDFHTPRHTCGAWLARSGAHAKVVQSVMRHSSITLTMDTYGHLFPSQEAETVGKLGGLLSCVDTAIGTARDSAQSADSCNDVQHGT